MLQPRQCHPDTQPDQMNMESGKETLRHRSRGPRFINARDRICSCSSSLSSSIFHARTNTNMPIPSLML